MACEGTSVSTAEEGRGRAQRERERAHLDRVAHELERRVRGELAQRRAETSAEDARADRDADGAADCARGGGGRSTWVAAWREGCERTELAERDNGGALRHLGLVLAVGLDGDERVLEDAADADADELFEQEQGEEVSAARACARAVNRRRTIWYPISLAIDECSSAV